MSRVGNASSFPLLLVQSRPQLPDGVIARCGGSHKGQGEENQEGLHGVALASMLRSFVCVLLYGSCLRLLEHAAFILRLYLVYIDMIPGIRRHHLTYLILYSFVTAVGRYVLINSYNRTSDTSICDGIALAEGPAHQHQILSTTRTDFVQRPAESTNFLTLLIRKSWIGRHPESELINPEQQTHGPTPK